MLYGPPGCGKSLLIQAFCNDCRRPTFVVAPSTLQSKYYGESNQRVKLLWSLVDLFQNHCVLVLDELDGLFRARNMDQEHEVSREVKTEFLQLWDGVMALKNNNNNNNNNNNSNNNHHQLVVIGATNRPFDVDPAVARRLPQSFFIGLPPLEDRRALLQMWCRQFEIPMAFDLLEQLAQATHLYTPSDLKQVLKQACQGGPLARGDLQLHLADFHLAMQQVPATKLHSSYVSKMQQYMGVMVHNHPNYPPPPHGGGGGADAAADGGNGYHQIGKWETHMGNFYHVGHVPVDDATLDALDHILTNYEPASSSSSEGGYSSDDEGYNNSSEEREGGEDDL
jgi:SpoVK/Ycf46/Vps4 family AAA+-type ATPase